MRVRKKQKYFSLVYLTLLTLLMLSFSSCQYFYDDTPAENSTTYKDTYKDVYYYPPVPYQPERAALSSPSGNTAVKTRRINVPESYHLSGGVPVSHQQRDEDWVSSQAPSGYTIQLANDKKPSVVAKVLEDTPKNNRTAQVRYEKDGKNVYMGIYGSYPDKAAAEAALNKLPSDIKEKAKIESWSKVQKETQPPKDPDTPESALPSVPQAPIE